MLGEKINQDFLSVRLNVFDDLIEEVLVHQLNDRIKAIVPLADNSCKGPDSKRLLTVVYVAELGFCMKDNS